MPDKNTAVPVKVLAFKKLYCRGQVRLFGKRLYPEQRKLATCGKCQRNWKLFINLNVTIVCFRSVSFYSNGNQAFFDRCNFNTCLNNMNKGLIVQNQMVCRKNYSDSIRIPFFDMSGRKSDAWRCIATGRLHNDIIGSKTRERCGNQFTPLFTGYNKYVVSYHGTADALDCFCNHGPFIVEISELLWHLFSGNRP